VSDEPPEPRRRSTDTWLRSPVLAHSLTSIISASIVALFAFGGDLSTSRTGQLRIAFDRIEVLEKTISVKDQQIASLQADIIVLKAQVQTRGNPLKPVFDYMDNLDRPAWLKVYHPDRNEFRMIHINPAYEQTYNVTNDFYRGRTDQEVHGSELAKKFLTLDLQVIGRRTFRASEELVRSETGGTKVIEVWKWFVPLPDGRMSVAGLQVSGPGEPPKREKADK